MKSLKIPLSWQIVLAVVLALLLSYFVPALAILAGEVTHLYIRLLSLILVPYLFFGVMSAFSMQSSSGFFGRLALKNLTWFVAFEMIAVITGLIISNIIFQNSVIVIETMEGVHLESPINFGDFLFSMIPQNIFADICDNNLFPLFLISCMLGFFIVRCSDKSRVYLSNFFTSMSELMQKVTDFVGALAPVGIFCLVCGLASDDSIFDKFNKVVPFIIALSIGFFLHSFVWLPLILKIWTKVGPFQLLKTFSSVIFTSMGFSSSTLAIPLITNKMKSEINVSPKIADFSVPMISILSFNGTSLYLCIAAMFIAQAYGINLSIVEQSILIFSVIFISIATNTIPLKLKVLLLPVLERMGIPIEGIGIIVFCDVFFGMISSGLDTWANICATTIIASSEGDDIHPVPVN
ncbi:MAG: cation:dicarboxylase symporter family transporter [Bacteroidales bacterium]|nr:cation:dicarboxylase symporter family transporter [Bacteroidales bacterium]